MFFLKIRCSDIRYIKIYNHHILLNWFDTYNLLSHFTVFVLKFIFPWFRFIFPQNIIFFPLACCFLCVFTSEMNLMQAAYYFGLFFFFHTARLCLLSNGFSLFTFKLFIPRWGLIPLISPPCFEYSLLFFSFVSYSSLWCMTYCLNNLWSVRWLFCVSAVPVILMLPYALMVAIIFLSFLDVERSSVSFVRSIMNSSSSCLLCKVFISPSFLKDTLTRYSNLGSSFV